MFHSPGRPDWRVAAVVMVGDDLHLVPDAVGLDVDVAVVRVEAEPVRPDVAAILVGLVPHLDGNAAGRAELATRLDHDGAVAEGEPSDAAG